MGYVQSIPSGLMSVSSGGIGTAWCTLTTVQTNISLGSLTTPDYKMPLSSAYVDLVFEAREDTSGADNGFDATAAGYLGMVTGGGGTFNCGAIHINAFYTPASTFQSGEYRLRGLTNIASLIKPNTTYTCQLMRTIAFGDNLQLFAPTFVLNLYFGM